jgi:transposase-like protein
MSVLNRGEFKNPVRAREYLERLRWPNGPVCPHCGSVSEDHYKLEGRKHREGVWKCKDCREQFSVTVGTVFHRSKIKLNIWLQAVYWMCASKKGISSKQLERMLGVTYKTAWFMSMRIREAMRSGDMSPLGGAGKIVEADETYFGNETGGSRKRKAGRALVEMNKIVSLVERGGKVRSFHVADVTGKNLKTVLKKQIHADSHVMTDASPRYNVIKREQPFAAYDQVNHAQGEYARGIASTNSVEGYFSILKRGLIGTYHHVSSAHLHRYTNEFDFRFNHREALGYSDTQRANQVLREIAGKRLTYRT